MRLSDLSMAARRGAPRTALRRRVRAAAGLAASVLGTLLFVAACSDSEVPNFNDPTLDPVVRDDADLQARISGLLAGDREQHAFQILILETMGRDAYRIDPADPRYINNPLGQFNPSAFITNFLWNSHYRTIRGALEVVVGVEPAAFLAAADKAGANGVARTVEALQYIRLIEMRDSLGVPINRGTGELDPIRCKAAVLDHIVALLDDAATDLAAAGTSFRFTLPAGFSSNGAFNTPAGFLEFNRALKAKAEIYRGFRDYARAGATPGTIDAAALNSALTALAASFLDPAGPLRDGVYHVYSTASGDLQNANFDLSVYRVNPKVITQAEAGDARLAKVRQDPEALRTVEGVSSDYLFTNITGPTTPLPIITNEELILLRAEAYWGLNQDINALADVNTIRQRAGSLLPVGAFANRLDLLREILKQKRYSLLYESGSRVVDYRMFGLFAELGTERTPPTLGPRALPFPEAETDARGGETACTQ
ncbi:MAG TPA: hypothetical protein VNA89_01230 [Gemmatimonadaceae bacterium]|nr:hypothetical protein [Gemmatimonadaceae bacterium]